MIVFKFPEEKTYALHYAKKINDEIIINFLEGDEVNSKDEAERLSLFFWLMVGKSIEDEKQGIAPVHVESNEFWNEKLLYSISGYLERQGYEETWAKVSDSQ